MHLPSLTLLNTVYLGYALEAAGVGGLSRDEAAGRIVRVLYDMLLDGDERACALVRLYATCRYRELEIMERGFARSMAKGLPIEDETVCLKLLATVGDRPEWNDPARSVDHRVIPLISEEVVQQMPMVAQLIHQLGVPVREVLNPDPNLMLSGERLTQNVFWVENAVGSPHIPVQEDFVLRCGIRSVVGFGGLMGSGELFAVILFSKCPIPEEAARRFRSLTGSARAALSGGPRGV